MLATGIEDKSSLKVPVVTSTGEIPRAVGKREPLLSSFHDCGLKNADETSEVNTQSSPTQTNPTFSHENLGAALAAY